jgi:hypothetical protein
MSCFQTFFSEDNQVSETFHRILFQGLCAWFLARMMYHKYSKPSLNEAVRETSRSTDGVLIDQSGEWIIESGQFQD